MSNTTNITSLILNDRLKEFIDYTKTRIDISSLLPTNHSMIEMLNTQDELRLFFVNNQYDGMLLNNKKLKLNSNQNPEFYALLVLLISDYEIADNWNDVMMYIKKYLNIYDFANKETRTHYGIDLSYNTYCACGKFLCSSEIFRMQNIQTNMSILLGNACILKNNIISRQELNALKKKKIEQAERFRESKERELMLKNDLKEQTDSIQMNTYLEVDFVDKDIVKAAGAKWCTMRKKWYVKGARQMERVKDYMIVDLCVPYELKDEAKAAGAKWDVIRKTWYSNAKKVEGGDLKRFVEGHISDEDED